MDDFGMILAGIVVTVLLGFICYMLIFYTSDEGNECGCRLLHSKSR